MNKKDVDKLLKDLNAQRLRLHEQLERTHRELDLIEQHINEVSKETTERLLQDERVDNALIEQSFMDQQADQ